MPNERESASKPMVAVLEEPESGLLDAFRAMRRIFLCDSGIKAESEGKGKTLRRGEGETGSGGELEWWRTGVVEDWSRGGLEWWKARGGEAIRDSELDAAGGFVHAAAIA